MTVLQKKRDLRWLRCLLPYRKPDFTVVQGEPEVIYLRRWWVIPRNKWFNIYLHQFMHSDDDRARHDHPWVNMSVLLLGRYIEDTPDGRFLRKPFRPVFRTATAPHRVELIDGKPVWSLFFTGRNERDWGFHCPQGWRIWTEFVAETKDGNKTGKGCE